MRCPCCGHTTTVINTQLLQNRLTVYRRRICRRSSCRHRFSTKETLSEGYQRTVPPRTSILFGSLSPVTWRPTP